MDPITKLIFEEEALRLGLSPALQEYCLCALERSISAGDGALWTDSVLSVLLDDPGSTVSRALSSMPGTRGQLMTGIPFNETTETQHLVERCTFQTPVLEKILDFRKQHPMESVDENTLLAIELREAIATYGHEHAELVDYVETWAAPVYERESRVSAARGELVALFRFEDRLTDAFILASMACIHPFDIFTADRSERVGSWKHSFTLRDIVRFLKYLRDLTGVPSRLLPDKDLKLMASTWDQSSFEDVFQDVYVDPYERSALYETDDPPHVDLTANLENAAFFAAMQLVRRGASIPVLLERLQRTEHSEPWNPSDALLLTFQDGRISAVPTDLIGVHDFQFADRAVEDEFLHHCGLVTPNPIWIPAVLDRFEYLINAPRIAEHELQDFFEMYPDLLLSDVHVAAIPQVTLVNETGKKLRPDFVLKRADGFADIVEIKKPLRKLVTGSEARPTLLREVARGINQLKEYGEWFRDSHNRRIFRERYGLDGFQPTLTLVIGRSSGFRNETVRRRSLSGTDVEIVTYDDLLGISRRRRDRALGRRT